MPRPRPYDDENLQQLDSQLRNRVVSIIEPDVLKQIVDNTDPNKQYICKAACGSNEVASVWQIQRITISGSITTIEWADGDGLFDNIASDRATLEYK